MRRVELAALRAASFAMGVLPDHVGQFRLAQWYWWRRRPGHCILPQRMADGTRLELDVGDRTQALAYLTRRYSEDLVREAVRRLPRSGLLFDVGANVGLVTFQVAHRRPDVRIVAFEPNPPAVQAWQRNHRLSMSPQVSLEPTAVSDSPGVVDVSAPSHDLGAGALATGGAGTSVAAITLDAYCTEAGIARIDVLKVDVEGAEPAVLAGARELLTGGAIRSLIVEFNDGYIEHRGSTRDSMVRWLREHGMVPDGPLDGGDISFVAAS